MGTRIVQCSCLGNFGGFGNQLFSYCFSKAYAERYDAELQIPKNWIGRLIFEGVDKVPEITNPLPKTKIDLIPFGKVNIDLFGYFQFKEALSIMSLSKIKSWLKFKREIVLGFTEERQVNYYIACHLRRKDYLTKYPHIYCIIPERSYIDACYKYNLNPNKIIWISDEGNERDDASLFFLKDFFTLMNSNILFRANSTFSFWASVLGGMPTYSPIVDGKTGVKEVDFLPGNHYKLVSDYRGASPHSPCDLIFGEE